MVRYAITAGQVLQEWVVAVTELALFFGFDSTLYTYRVVGHVYLPKPTGAP